MNDYEELLKFWNACFENSEGYLVDGKFVDSEIFNEIIKTYVNENTHVLDFGSGSGWGLLEIFVTSPFKEGLGIDPAPNSIKMANECVTLSKMEAHLKFIEGDQKILSQYPEYFDFIFSTNVLDVVPDDIMFEILEALYYTLKKGGYALICLNPAFTEIELTETLKMDRVGTYYYKNGILRCNYKQVKEWEELFSKHFKVIESKAFKLISNDKYERRLYLLKKD